MRITHQIHLLLYKIKQRVFGTQIDKIRRGVNIPSEIEHRDR